MALIAHHVQGSYAGFPVRTQPRADLVKSKPIVSFRLVGRANRSILSKRHFRLSLGCTTTCFCSIGGQYRRALKGRQFKILSFKGNLHNEESEGIASPSKFSKNPVQLSFVPQEKEETVMEPPDRPNGHFSYASAQREETVGGSPAIQEMFKKWLIMLLTQTASRTAEEILKESPSKSEITKPQHGTQQGGAGDLLKVLLDCFLGLDTAIKFPPLIFLPWYLAVNVAYGPEVSRELTPLWVLGPLVVALYIKLIQGLVSLYIFTYKQTIRLVKNLPTVRAFLWTHVWRPVTGIRYVNSKELLKQKMKELRESVGELYLDFLESIWPYYCRTLRLLKGAKLI